MEFRLVIACVLAVPLTLAAFAQGGSAADYPREHIYDLTTRPDDAAVNVSLVSNRWPDCTTLESAIESIFRLEGVADRAKANDQARALALWKWFRILVSATGGAYAYEGPPGKADIVHDPHKIFTVYGHHQCDGMSWAMVPLWRAAGYMAFDECHNGHTIAALRYRDDDGITRYHNLDPQGRFYYWDEDHNRVGCWSMPVFTGHVFRHLMTPQDVHSLRTHLRIGETIDRRWNNAGHIVPHGKPDQLAKMAAYYEYKPGRTDGVYAAAGEEVQTFDAPMAEDTFKLALSEGSSDIAWSAPKDGAATLHPAEKGKPAVAVYHLGPPYVIVDATIEATMVSGANDACKLSISADGKAWQPVCTKQKAGVETVKIDAGKAARDAARPDVYTSYDLWIKAEFQTGGDLAGVGLSKLKATTIRMLNKRTLPNLMPGENYFQLSADKLPPGYFLQVEVNFEHDGKPDKQVYLTNALPYQFRIDLPGWQLRKIANYDKDFNNEAARMISYALKLVPALPETEPTTGIPAELMEGKFTDPFPHPGDMTDRKIRKGEQAESDPIQTSGFVPQSRLALHDKAKMDELIKQIESNSEFKKYVLIQQLGAYPEALDYLIGLLGKLNIDGVVYVVKGLAQIGDPKATDPLLAKWQRHMKKPTESEPVGSLGGAPGTRYIPDALAAISVKSGKLDPRIVPALVAPLRACRFDFRFHIAHALGELGPLAESDSESRKLAQQALKDMAERDPFPAVREEARAALAKLAK